MSTSQSLASLSASVTSLRSSLTLLDSSISILDAGISDFPRLKTVLSSTRHFELTPSTTLSAAQASLASELAPAITTLLQRSEQYIAKLERKQNNLAARSELLEGRLEGGGGGVRRQRSLEKLRLGYAVERLTLQSQQRQRQLRMSVAAT
ncbi:hypothetical protein NA56DRAFT_303579 [Hyaloscypha hepaticicola]|uniref:DASH complex subunit SPC19 n=1 Tax=Hyaloscypha hepaticicola TaxID=2082293 RepID=A0A2J6PS54_9HELO|nr:hypothetical protein NA56DRAFT_303579 [Hyaloscypha hepaticicola]